MLAIAVHPGEILADELDEAEISAAELARQLHVPANRIGQLLASKRSVTADTALRLGHWFGTGPQFWLNLQTAYDLRLAYEQSGETILQLPVARTEAQCPVHRPLGQRTGQCPDCSDQ